MNCPACLQVIPDNNNFCDYCGAPTRLTSRPRRRWFRRLLIIAGGSFAGLVAFIFLLALLGSLIEEPPTEEPTAEARAAEAPAPAAPDTDLPAMLERVKLAVVRIETPDGSGSGVIVETNAAGAALVLSNYHVVEDAPWVSVEVRDSETFRGELAGFDPGTDLAVIEICCGDFAALEFGDAAQVWAGSEVLAVGYPLGLPGEASVTRGIVSAIRSLEGVEVIQMDAPINPGSSGGPLVSEQGTILGINTFGIRDMESLGFAVSERTVQAALPRLKATASSGFALAPAATPDSQSTPLPTPTPAPTPLPTFTPNPTATPRPTATSTPTPTPLPQPIKMKAISSSGTNHCGLRLDNTPVCWSMDQYQLKWDYLDGEKLKKISVGIGGNGTLQTCGIRESDTLLCLGIGESIHHDYWRDMQLDQKFFDVDIGGYGNICALHIDGTPQCWGWDYTGMLSPPEGEKFTAISVGHLHTCALRVDGTSVCWGDSYLYPPNGEKFRLIDSGFGQTCGLRLDNGLVCWANNYFKRASNRREVSNRPPIGEKFIDLSGDCALKQEGSVVCWGFDHDLSREGNYISIATGVYGGNVCALRSDYFVDCWGSRAEDPPLE